MVHGSGAASLPRALPHEHFEAVDETAEAASASAADLPGHGAGARCGVGDGRLSRALAPGRAPDREHGH
ncbi:hypothetical protein [Streptomyces clavifer]|uniref:hypothetical protein n=1 Tax=Streptomyces clavifer TaxID=68188 RepID=UPI00365F883C